MTDRTRVRMPALAVLAAFLLGIGPGAPVQPCLKHRGMHGGQAAAPVASSGSHDPHDPHDLGPANGHGDHGGAERHDPTGPTHSHSDGPCDCLANCLTCCGPAVVGSSLRGVAATPASDAMREMPLRSVTVADPAAHLRPLGRSPPA